MADACSVPAQRGAQSQQRHASLPLGEPAPTANPARPSRPPSAPTTEVAAALLRHCMAGSAPVEPIATGHIAEAAPLGPAFTAEPQMPPPQVVLCPAAGAGDTANAPADATARRPPLSRPPSNDPGLDAVLTAPRGDWADLSGAVADGADRATSCGYEVGVPPPTSQFSGRVWAWYQGVTTIPSAPKPRYV
jgi:hypothetical protein